MNDASIRQYVDEIFKDVKMSAKALEQKEELTVNITERVRDYMREGLSFDAAFDTAKNIVGDTDELTAPFEKISSAAKYDSRQYAPQDKDTPADAGISAATRRGPRFQMANWKLAALSPFVYVLLGFTFGWWAWAWVIIPVAGVFSSPTPIWTKLVAVSPFAYVMLGFLFGWWAWGWIIIPVSGILCAKDYSGK